MTATPPELLLAGAGPSAGLRRTLELSGTGGVLHVAATVASCDTGVEHPACRISQQDWRIPVRLAAAAPAVLRLVLRG